MCIIGKFVSCAICYKLWPDGRIYFAQYYAKMYLWAIKLKGFFLLLSITQTTNFLGIFVLKFNPTVIVGICIDFIIKMKHCQCKYLFRIFPNFVTLRFIFSTHVWNK